MKTASCFVNLLLATLLLASLKSDKADVLIDSFATPQSAPGGVDTVNVADGAGILGGERDVQSFLALSANGTVFVMCGGKVRRKAA